MGRKSVLSIVDDPRQIVAKRSHALDQHTLKIAIRQRIELAGRANLAALDPMAGEDAFLLCRVNRRRFVAVFHRLCARLFEFIHQTFGGNGGSGGNCTRSDGAGGAASTDLTVVVVSPDEHYLGGTANTIIDGSSFKFGGQVLDGSLGNDVLLAGKAATVEIGGRTTFSQYERGG